MPLFSHPDYLAAESQAGLQNELQLLTLKPILYVFNVDEAGLGDDALRQRLSKIIAPSQAIFICAKLESELQGLDELDAAELLESYGAKESGLLQLIHAAYDTLGLQSYLTAGKDEVRAWTIAKGAYRATSCRRHPWRLRTRLYRRANYRFQRPHRCRL